jgi:hypothetical protein
MEVHLSIKKQHSNLIFFININRFYLKFDFQFKLNLIVWFKMTTYENQFPNSRN